MNFQKQTITTDNEGNNNLNLKIEPTKKIDYKNLLRGKIRKILTKITIIEILLYSVIIMKQIVYLKTQLIKLIITIIF